MPEDRSDTELLIASRDDPAAFRVLYDRWAMQLMTYFYRRTFDPEVAADLVAETFAVAYLRRHRFRDIGRPAGAWLYGIARRELGRWRRRRGIEHRAVQRLGVQLPELDDGSIARIEELVDVAAYRRQLDAAVAGLTERQREAVRLRVVEERSYADVAEALGCSEGAARVRVHRALVRLAETLETAP
jgi:RNA polymerase sigma-70 factor (ECF subfamily)